MVTKCHACNGTPSAESITMTNNPFYGTLVIRWNSSRCHTLFNNSDRTKCGTQELRHEYECKQKALSATTTGCVNHLSFVPHQPLSCLYSCVVALGGAQCLRYWPRSSPDISSSCLSRRCVWATMCASGSSSSSERKGNISGTSSR